MAYLYYDLPRPCLDYAGVIAVTFFSCPAALSDVQCIFISIISQLKVLGIYPMSERLDVLS